MKSGAAWTKMVCWASMALRRSNNPVAAAFGYQTDQYCIPVFSGMKPPGSGSGSLRSKGGEHRLPKRIELARIVGHIEHDAIHETTISSNCGLADLIG